MVRRDRGGGGGGGVGGGGGGLGVFFFFKQKTAYEIYQCDWSSDVCSSDLEEKRHLYKAFITNAIESPGEPYDDQIRLLRTFEELIPDHLRVLKAMSQIPNPDPGMTGSPNQTLSERLPEFDGQQIELLINELNGMRLTNLASLKVLMTGRGASDLRNAITDYGNRILNYIREAKNKRGR